jgi:hypothetical protein
MQVWDNWAGTPSNGFQQSVTIRGQSCHVREAIADHFMAKFVETF